MTIEIPDELAQKCGINEKDALELLVIALYKTKGIHGTLAGKMLSISDARVPQVAFKAWGTSEHTGCKTS